MKRAVFLLSSLTLIVAFAPSAYAEKPIARGPLGKKLDEYLTRLSRAGFSGAVLVAMDGKVALRKGYGLADRENGVPVTPETVFTVGSITKQFTGAAIVKLEMMGKLQTDQKLSEFFDNVPPGKANITVHQLATHTAGFPEAMGFDFDPEGTKENVFKMAMACELAFPPGSRHQYSNTGYSLLGMIVEKTSGMGYEEFLRKELFLPSRMKRTGYLLPEYEASAMAIGYRDGERWGTFLDQPRPADGFSWHLQGNGGIQSTVGDMYRWHQTLLDDKVLSSEAKAKYFAPHVDEGSGDSFYGYGWVNWKTRRGTRLLSHNGGNPYFSADCHRYVDEDAFIFITSNSAIRAFAITDRLDAIMFDHAYELPPQFVALGDGALSQRAGTYTLASGETIDVSAGPGRLILTGSGEAVAELLAGGGDATRHLREQTARITKAWVEGDLKPMHEAFGGSMALHRLEQVHEESQQNWKRRLGASQGIGAVSAVAGPDGARSYAEMKFERGSEYFVLQWEQGRLVAIGLEDREPWGTSGRVEAFPVSDTEFVSFSLTSPTRVRAAFETDGKTLVLGEGDGRVNATRNE